MRAAALLLLAGCAFEPPSGERFAPPAEYRAWWDSAQACSGRQGRFDELHFLVVEGYSFDCPGGECAGYTKGQTITLASEWTGTELVVKHEMIHALGVDGHPDVPFVTPCRAVWK
jgi:hypothetical protein